MPSLCFFPGGVILHEVGVGNTIREDLKRVFTIYNILYLKVWTGKGRNQGLISAFLARAREGFEKLIGDVLFFNHLEQAQVIV